MITRTGLLVIWVVALVSPAWAQMATIVVAERRGAVAHYVVEFTDRTQLDLEVPATSTVEAVREIIKARRTPPPLLSRGTVIDLSIEPPSPDPPQAPTAQDVWVDKARRLMRLKTLVLTNATALTDITALEAEVEELGFEQLAAELLQVGS